MIQSTSSVDVHCFFSSLICTCRYMVDEVLSLMSYNPELGGFLRAELKTSLVFILEWKGYLNFWCKQVKYWKQFSKKKKPRTYPTKEIMCDGWNRSTRRLKKRVMLYLNDPYSFNLITMQRQIDIEIWCLFIIFINVFSLTAEND